MTDYGREFYQWGDGVVYASWRGGADDFAESDSGGADDGDGAGVVSDYGGDGSGGCE